MGVRILHLAGRSTLSFISYNLGWWVCAIGVMKGQPWLGPALMPLWLGLHFYFSPTASGDAAFFVVLCAFGFAVDSLLLNFNLFTIGSATLAPLWLVSMWVLLGLNFESMLVWRDRRWAFLAVGAVTGPLTYIWCDAIQILAYFRPLWLAIPLHILLWAGLTPLLFWFRERILSAILRAQREVRVSRPPEQNSAPAVEAEMSDRRKV